MSYDETILNDLINIYEKRDANSSNFKKKIKLKLTKEKYSKYFLDVSGYDEAIDRLLKKDFISVKKIPHDTVIDSIILNIDKVESIKEELNFEEDVSSFRKRLLNELSKYNDDVIVKFKNNIEKKLEEGKGIKTYLNDDYIDSIKAVHYMENLKNDIFIRNASNYLYNDSKKLSHLKSTINSIYGLEDSFKEKGIISLPQYLYIKGEGIVYLNEETINLTKLNSSIGIPINDIDKIKFENISSVTTIENLTTFYDFQGKGLIVYLGGFSTRSQMNVLFKLKKVCNEFYHFGDIDFGGYTILNNLIETLDIDIKTIKMDLETLKSNIRYAQTFDDNKYIDKLKSLLNKPNLKQYYDVIEYMIEKHIWLEQESFYNI